MPGSAAALGVPHGAPGKLIKTRAALRGESGELQRLHGRPFHVPCGPPCAPGGLHRMHGGPHDAASPGMGVPSAWPSLAGRSVNWPRRGASGRAGPSAASSGPRMPSAGPSMARKSVHLPRCGGPWRAGPSAAPSSKRSPDNWLSTSSAAVQPPRPGAPGSAPPCSRYALSAAAGLSCTSESSVAVGLPCASKAVHNPRPAGGAAKAAQPPALLSGTSAMYGWLSGASGAVHTLLPRAPDA
eukprot:357838-Chlamydomonas_euryale.AAC.2